MYYETREAAQKELYEEEIRAGEVYCPLSRCGCRDKCYNFIAPKIEECYTGPAEDITLTYIVLSATCKYFDKK